MKMQDIIRELQTRLPLVSDLFTDNFSIVAAAVDKDEKIIFTTDKAHDLKPNDLVNIFGVKNGIPIDQSWVVNGAATLEFKTDHGYNLDRMYQQKITIVNSTNANGTYDLIDVPNNQKLVIDFNGKSIDGPAMIVVDEGFDGYYDVAGTDTATTFAVDQRKDTFLKPMNAISGGKMNTRIRISGAADMERFNSVYTAQKDMDDCWLVVTPPENRASRDRTVTTDAISGMAQPGAGNGPVDVRQFQVETVNLYAVIPSSMELAGRRAADIAEEVRWSLYNSLCVAEVPTLAKDGEVYAIMPVRDGYYAYLTDNTTYTHEYTFERTVVMGTNDVAKPRDQTAPFRGLDLEVLPCEHDKG